MAKTLEEKLKEKMDRADELKKTIADATKELAEIYGLAVEKPKGDPTPANFALGQEVINIFKASEGKIFSIIEMVEVISEKFNFRPDRKNIQSTLYYLVTKGELKKAGRGAFELANK